MFNDLIPLSRSLPSDHRRVTISLGKLGTAETIDYMRDAATNGKRNFEVRKLAGKIIRSKCPNKDFLCYAQAIFEYCRDQVYYAFDPQGVELVEKPHKVLEAGIADCDSIVPLCASMLESIGLECRYVTIKADVKRPDDYSHVFLECLVPGNGWIPMDPTMPDKPFGWGPDQKWPRKTWPASHDASEDHGGDTTLELVKKVSGADMSGYLGYLNAAPKYDADEIPGVEETVGVHQGNDFAWRMEPAAITASPEQLELQPFGSKPRPVGAPTQDFFIRDDAATVLRDKAEQMNLENIPVMVAAPQAAVPNWLWLVLAGAGAYLLLRKNR